MRKFIAIIFLLILAYGVYVSLITQSLDDVLAFEASDVSEILIQPSKPLHASAPKYLIREAEYYEEIMAIINQIKVSPLRDDYDMPYVYQPNQGYYLWVLADETYSTNIWILNDQYIEIDGEKYKVRQAPDLKQIMDVVESIPNPHIRW